MHRKLGNNSAEIADFIANDVLCGEESLNSLLRIKVMKETLKKNVIYFENRISTIILLCLLLWPLYYFSLS